MRQHNTSPRQPESQMVLWVWVNGNPAEETTRFMRYTKASPCPDICDSRNIREKFQICATCGLHRYQARGVDEDQLRNLVYKRENNTKPRFYLRADGMIMTADCPLGRAKRLKVTATLFSLFLLILLGTIIGFSTGPARDSAAQVNHPSTWDIDSVELAESLDPAAVPLPASGIASGAQSGYSSLQAPIDTESEQQDIVFRQAAEAPIIVRAQPAAAPLPERDASGFVADQPVEVKLSPVPPPIPPATFTSD